MVVGDGVSVVGEVLVVVRVQSNILFTRAVISISIWDVGCRIFNGTKKVCPGAENSSAA